MKRFLLLLLVLGVGGYAAYVKVPAFHDQVNRLLAKFENVPPALEAQEQTAQATPAPAVNGATPFTSKIEPSAPDAPREKQLAPPGIFYMTERVSVETRSGVQAVVPGDQVKLLQRLPNGRMRVTIGTADFEIKESQATNDLDVAREAEKADFVARGGKL
jgi:hypothetical protein